MARTTTKTASTTKPSAASVLGSIGKKGASKTTSKTPIIAITERDHLAAMAAIIDAKNAVKQAESALNLAEGEFRGTATEMFEDKCRNDRVLHSSIKLVGREGSETLALLYTQSSVCCKMQEEEAAEPLQSVFGDEFDNLFQPRRTIAVDTSVLTEEQTIKVVEAMQTALGDVFNSAVTVERLIEPKDSFFSRRILDNDVRVMAQRAAEDGYAKMKSPFFKIG